MADLTLREVADALNPIAIRIAGQAAELDGLRLMVPEAHPARPVLDEAQSLLSHAWQVLGLAEDELADEGGEGGDDA
jgi:hypothetical protein